MAGKRTPCRYTPRIGMLAPWTSVPATTMIEEIQLGDEQAIRRTSTC
jgi:hypothetical protein